MDNSSSRQRSTRFSQNFSVIEREIPACGDFGGYPSSMVYSGHHYNNSNNEPTTMAGPPSPPPEKSDDIEIPAELLKLSKTIEEYIKERRKSIEEKLFEKFYFMRIEQSRKFIELASKINNSWDDFIFYLKSVGEDLEAEGEKTGHTSTSDGYTILHPSDE